MRSSTRSRLGLALRLRPAGDEAKALFAAVALSEELEDFLTVPAYDRLDEEESR